MTQKIFNLIASINCEGIDNGMWSLYDLGQVGASSKITFGTDVDMTIKGKVVIMWAKKDDYFCWIDTASADYKLPCGEGQDLYIWSV
jgi:hypothetical protein